MRASANARAYRIFCRLKPAACSVSSLAHLILCGPVSRASRSRPQMALAAATLICWLTIALSNCANPSGRRRNGSSPLTLSAFANRGSAVASHCTPSATQVGPIIILSLCISPHGLRTANLGRTSHHQFWHIPCC